MRTLVRAKAGHEIRRPQTAGEYVGPNLVDLGKIHDLLVIEVCLWCLKQNPFHTGNLKGKARRGRLMQFKDIVVEHCSRANFEERFTVTDSQLVF